MLCEMREPHSCIRAQSTRHTLDLSQQRRRLVPAESKRLIYSSVEAASALKRVDGVSEARELPLTHCNIHVS